MSKNKQVRLTETQVLKLVELYKENVSLWDPRHVLYNNKEARENGYRNIWKKLNIPSLTVKDIPQKIKNIRSSYYQELKKIDASIKNGDTGGALYKPKIIWFRIVDDMFKSISGTPELIKPEIECEDNIVNTDTDSTEKTINNLDRIADNVSSNRSNISQHSTTEQYINNEGDEFDLFGKYIAIALRSMPIETAIISKMELQKTLTDIQLRSLRQRNQVVQPESGGSTSNANQDPLEPLTAKETIVFHIKSEFED